MRYAVCLLCCLTIICLLLGMMPVCFAEGEENLYREKGTALTAGKTYFFGPVDAEEDTLGTFDGEPLLVKDAVLGGTFMKGQKLYCYTPSVSAVFEPNVKKEYTSFYLLAESQSVNPTVEDYYAYWDNRGANLYNAILDGIDGFYTSATARNTTKNHRSTHFIAVKAGDTITFGPSNPQQGWHGIALDANRAVKDEKIEKGELTASAQSVQNGLVFYTYTVPQGVAYVSLINYTPVQSFFMALKNAPALTPDTYYAHRGVTENPLYGKTALFVGDSISFGENDSVQNSIRLAWAGRIGLANGLTYTNASVSGTALSTLRGARILSQITGKAGNHYDFVVLHGGVNDAWGNGSEGYIPAPVGKMTEGFSGPFDKTTYAGGFEETIAAAKANFPDAKLIYVMNFRASECPRGTVSDMSAYFAEGAKICKKWGVTVCDLYSRYNFDDPNYLDDRMIHINQYGYDIVYPHIAAAMMASEQAPMVEKKIDAIGRVSLENIPLIEDAAKSYHELEGEVRSYVENADRLQKYEQALKNGIMGDVNMDGRAAIADLCLLLRYSSGYMPLNRLNYHVADFNGDGAIDTADCLAFARDYL